MTSQGGFRSRFNLNGNIEQSSMAIFEVSNGGYLSAGISIDTINNKFRYRLSMMGLNSTGQLQWVKHYGNLKFEFVNNIFLRRSFYRDGNYFYYAGGVKDSTNNYVGVLMKFNEQGDTIWQKIFSEPGYNVMPQMVTKSADGGFLITGFFENSSSRPCMLIKTNANGDEYWRQKINKVAPNAHDGRGIIQDSATKKIAIVGYQYLGTATAYSTHDNLLVLDSLGNVLDQNYFTGGVLSDIIQTKDKHLIVTGSYPIPNDDYYSYALKIDINNPATPVWSIFSFGKKSKSNNFTCLKELSNGDIVIGGMQDTLHAAIYKHNISMRHVFIRPDGSIKKIRNYNYQYNDTSLNLQILLSLEPTSDGGLVSAIRVNNKGIRPFFFVKYDSLGCDTSEYYCKTVSVDQFKIEDSRFKVYPNPANNILNVETPNLPFSKKDIRIIDAMGRNVFETRFDETKVDIDLKQLPAGLYFIQLNVGREIISTQKFIKQ